MIEISREFDSRCQQRVDLVSALKPGAHIHLSGVCGTGMAAVLRLLKDQGFYVSGSDKAFYPPMGDIVRNLADAVFEGYSAANLSLRPVLVVIGNALSADNPEVVCVLDQGIDFASMAEVFAARLIGDRDYCPNSVVVAGTHGKTTTTAAIATALEASGRMPGYFIGGKPYSLPASIRQVSSELPIKQRVVVLEGDEYDSAFFAKFAKFQCYRPDLLVITSLEFDHADIYRSLTEIREQFFQVALKVPESGMILVCDERKYLRDFAEELNSRPEIKSQVRLYGKDKSSPYQLLERKIWRYQDIPAPRDGQELKFRLGERTLVVRTVLTGEHNALNLLATATICRRLGVGDDDIKRGIQNFSGVCRRQEVIADADGVLIIEDFAHHPTAVRLTLQGIRESYPTRRIVAVFEPRSNTSRRQFFQDEYADSFDAADCVLMLEVSDPGGYAKEPGEIQALDVQKIINQLRSKGKEAFSFSSVSELEQFILRIISSGDLVMLMSNGDFGGLPKSLPEKLSQRAARA